MKDDIEFADFQKLDLRAAKIIAAESVEGSDKLLKLRVDLGESGERQIVAGIGRVYTPEALANRLIIIAANLKPRILMGLESQGMLLAADTPDGPALLGTEPNVLPGASIR
jgi:methionine--tRNA ligase beta chain